jgi:cellulose synthase/poly-beta-1,6-N-acetylglucosamine synthase-like glycosyltransferase
MQGSLEDTYSQLPAITRPVPSIPLRTLRSGAQLSSLGIGSGVTNPELAALAHDEGRRWSAWGAARDGARTVVSRRQRLVVASCLAVALAICVLLPRALLLVPVAFVTCAYLLAGAYKALLLLRGERRGQWISADPFAVPDESLPLYTVLVPLFHECAFTPVLVDQLLTLDYPADRLEVLLLVEADDDETRGALARCDLPDHVHVVVVPPGVPRTKPRALNAGLAYAGGEFVVIYDAEDRPEPLQLRKAVAAFRSLPRRVVCLQARLNFYNRHQSLLTRLFSVDYAVWYDMLLPGLVSDRAVVPLGGTSNHFRVAALRRLGGWDPYNVTEDADLGVRIARAGLHVRMLDSITWEEAVAQMRPWVRQRSRWIKGYMQTYLVHMRHPHRLFRQIGPRAFLDFQLLLGGTSLLLLVNPIMWALTIAFFVAKGTPLGGAIHLLYPTPLYYPALACLVANYLFFYMQLYIVVRRGYDDLARFALLGPLYWVLMSVGAWVGLLSLVRDPHYWAKTEHGISLGVPSSAAYFAAVRGVLATGRSSDGPKLSIVIPAFNEALRLPASLERLRRYLDAQSKPIEVIVVDDGSSDATVEVVQRFMANWPALRLVQGEHRGKGGATRAGVFAAEGEYVALADADFSMPVEEFERFGVEMLGEYDVAIGSREATGARRLDEPQLRRVMSYVFNLLVRTTLVPGIHDTQCGFKCLRRDAALDLCLHQTINGWCFDVELLHIARLRGFRVCEVPVTWRYVPGSRVSPLRDTLLMLRDVFTIRIRSWRGRYTASRSSHVAGSESIAPGLERVPITAAGSTSSII